MRAHKIRKIVISIFCCAVLLTFIWKHYISMPAVEEWIKLDDPRDWHESDIGHSIVNPNPKTEHMIENPSLGKQSSPDLIKELNLIQRDDIDFTNKMERILHMRQRKLEDSCVKANLSRPLPIGFSISDLRYKPALAVSDTHKTVFCFTGDVYSEMWREVLGSSDVRSIYSYRPESIAYRMKYYYKFLVAQDPLLRLMDAYHFGLSSSVESKVFDVNGEDISGELLHLSQLIRSDYEAENNYASKESHDGHIYARLQDFATYVLQKTFLNEQHHYLWERLHVMCNPCSIKYDYISRAETAINDVQYIKSKLPTSSEEMAVPVDVNSQTSISQLTKFRDTFGTDLLKKLSLVYERDYEMFGYDLPKL